MLRAGHIEPQNVTEKGSQHGPIQLPMYKLDSDTCSLQSYIDLWHDGLGVCRAAQKAGQALVICISRFLPETGAKSLQKIDFETTVRFPCFDNLDGNAHFHLYEIAGFIYHLGRTPNSGHYRAVLCCHNKWLIYDDGKLPDPMHTISDYILRNTVMFWLLPATGTTARHMMDQRNAGLPDGPVELLDDPGTPGTPDADVALNTPRP